MGPARGDSQRSYPGRPAWDVGIADKRGREAWLEQAGVSRGHSTRSRSGEGKGRTSSGGQRQVRSMVRVDSSQARTTGPTEREERVNPSGTLGEPSAHPAQAMTATYEEEECSSSIRNTWRTAGCGPACPVV